MLDAPNPHVPGPGNYEIAAPIHDYRGIYKNMGKKKKKKVKRSDDLEAEEEVAVVSQHDSENSEDERKEAKDLVPDVDAAAPEETAEKPQGTLKSKIPGQS